MLKRHLTSALALVGLVLIFLVSYSASAFAAGAVLPTDSSPIGDMLRAVYDAFRGGHSAAAGALALFTFVALFKRYSSPLGAKVDGFLHSDVGGALTTAGLAFFGAVAAATSAGALSMSVISTAGGIAVAAVGGYTLIKKLVIDRLEATDWYKNSAPSWLKFLVSLIDPPSAIEIAEKAGADAVAKQPSAGTEPLVPPATKF